MIVGAVKRGGKAGGTMILTCPIDNEPITVNVVITVTRRPTMVGRTDGEAAVFEEQLQMETAVDHSGCMYNHHGAPWTIERGGEAAGSNHHKAVRLGEDTDLAYE
jgi:hypothetical protein